MMSEPLARVKRAVVDTLFSTKVVVLPRWTAHAHLHNREGFDLQSIGVYSPD